jgi:glycosyltransferase involved in cell wall biosynthesis
MPRVSIAVPTYNCEKYISQSLESLLAQTYGNFELIISDNASTDRTGDICREFAARDSRIRYARRTENIGGPGNFRHVFTQCSGEYHKWSTGDDYWDPTYLEKCVAVLDSRPDVVLCYTKTRLVNADNKPIEDYEDNLDLQDERPASRFNTLLDRIGLCNAHLGVIRREALLKTRLIGKELGSDIHFLAELSLYGKFRLLPEHLFFRRYHQHSSSWNRTSSEHQQQYYAPGKKAAFGFHTWAKYRSLGHAVWRSPIPFGQKLALSSDLFRAARWDRHKLFRELAGAARLD